MEQPLKILIIDDDEHIRATLYDFLSDKKYDVTSASDGLNGLKLLESELFGFERGAFTGANRKKRGKFELAHQGVLFLDEIGDMSLFLQSKLLHVLQTGEFSPLGSEKEVKTDAWVITATNQELEKKVEKKLFREDLYYRLNMIKIYIPPLRNSPDTYRCYLTIS